MIIRVRDLLSTRYIINSLAGAFRNAVLDALNSGTTLDLAGCRLGPNCEDILDTYQDRVKFINSEEPELNAILENNREILNTTYEAYEELEFPVVDGNFDFANYIAELPTGKYSVRLYDAKTNNYSITLSMICLVILCRPDIELDLSACVLPVLERLSKDLNIEALLRAGHTRFYKAYPPIVEEVSSTDEDFSYTDHVIPIEIGNEVIFNMSTATVKSDDYLQLIQSLLNDLISSVNNVKDEVYIRLIDMLRYKEDSVDDY